MASPTSAPPQKQPKVVQKLLLRTFGLLITLAALLFAFQWYQARKKDLGGGQRADTAGWISAIEYKNDGQEAVAIKPDQTIVRPAGWKEGVTDRDVVWAPGGHFIFFISDRGEDGFHVNRWNPETNVAEVRSVSNRGRSAPTFKVNQAVNDQTMLITSGGNIFELDPTEKRQAQVLPPLSREISVSEGDEGGVQSQFTALYGNIGTSFRYARYCGPDNNFIAAIMKRDQGDIMLVQNMVPKDDKFEPPAIIAAGDRIEMDVNPKDGSVVYAVSGFQWPGAPPREFIKNGKITTPYRHYVGLWTATPPPAGTLPLIVASPDDRGGFGTPVIHPSGEFFVATIGPVKDGALDHKALGTFPVKYGGGSESKIIASGEIYEPAWSPSGEQLVFAKREGSARNIYTANKDGSSQRNVTSGTSRYGYPQFSPQTK